jgi:prepilin-type N-terminal cleavage/methylation domain-containing protein
MGGGRSMACFKKSKGFTLIELMLVSVIIGLLSTIAVQKMGDLIWKSKEAVVKGQLGALRAALFIFYGDNEGIGLSQGCGGLSMCSHNTTSLDPLVPKYIEAIPKIAVPYEKYISHKFPGNGVINNVANDNLNDQVVFYGHGGGPGSPSFSGTISWVYSQSSVNFYVNCTHPDSTGRVWSTW